MWHVGRQWLPVRVRLRPERDPGDRWWHAADGLDALTFADFSVGGVIAAFAAIVAAIVLVAVVWPIVALALEVVILLILFLGGLAGRLVFRRPWRIVARTKGEPREVRAWHVVGWRASAEVVDEVARSLAAGQRPNPAGAEPVLVEERRGLSSG